MFRALLELLGFWLADVPECERTGRIIDCFGGHP